MKKIEAIIRPEKLSVVRKAIEELGVLGVTITDVKGHGTQRGVEQRWRGTAYAVELLPKVKLETVIPDELVERVLQVIHEMARTGEIGDGKVFVLEIADAMRVRTGERGKVAI
ncbi:MAG: P-II family nitrogen regulator [Chloroflexota bacterium]|nr:P-II family nitrogen regulator [Chloroflexota bacterium]